MLLSLLLVLVQKQKQQRQQHEHTLYTPYKQRESLGHPTHKTYYRHLTRAVYILKICKCIEILKTP